VCTLFGKHHLESGGICYIAVLSCISQFARVAIAAVGILSKPERGEPLQTVDSGIPDED